MKKLLFLLFALVTVTMQAQTANGSETEFEAVKTTSPQTVSTSQNVVSIGADGTNGKVAGENITTTYTPVNYAPASTTIKSQLTAIDTRLGQIGNPTAGITQRINFTGDNITVAAGTMFASNGSGKGTATSGLPTPLVNGDNQKQYFTKDLISIAQPSPTTAPPGVYSGQLTVSSTPTPNGTQQRYTIEIYKTNNGGTPIASGITGAPTGNLGVTVVAILDSGLVNLVAGAITNIGVTGTLASTLSLATGERLRYHVSAQKVGSGGGNVTMSVLYGSDYNSYYDVTVTPKASAVINDSGVVGGSVADALNTLNTGKQNTLTNPITGTGTTNYLPKFTGSTTQSISTFFDNGTNAGLGTATPYNDPGYRSFTVNGTSGGIFASYINGILGGYLSSNSTQTSLIESRNMSLGLYTNNVERVTITGSGNVGLGTNTPATSPNNTTLGFVNGSLIQGRNSVPQLSFSSNIDGDYYSATYKTNNPAVQIVLDALGGEIVFKRAISGTVGNPVTWIDSGGFSSTGVFKVNNLAGTGTRTVVADASGNLSATDIVPTSGTYTPTLTNTTNVTSASLLSAIYTRVGDIVTVYMAVTVNITSASTLSTITATLPINRVSTSNTHSGSGSAAGNAFTNSVPCFYVLPSNTTSISITFIPTATGAYTVSGSFSYKAT